MVALLIVLLLFYFTVSLVIGVGFSMFESGVGWFTLAFGVFSALLCLSTFIKYKKSKWNYVSIFISMFTFLMLSITIGGLLHIISVNKIIFRISFGVCCLALLFIIIFRITDRIFYGLGKESKNILFNKVISILNLILVSIAYEGFFYGFKSGATTWIISSVFFTASIISIITSINFKNLIEDDYEEDEIEEDEIEEGNYNEEDEYDEKDELLTTINEDITDEDITDDNIIEDFEEEKIELYNEEKQDDINENIYEEAGDNKESYHNKHKSNKLKITLVIALLIIFVGGAFLYKNIENKNLLTSNSNTETSSENEDNEEEIVDESEVDDNKDVEEVNEAEDDNYPYTGIKYNTWSDINTIECIEGNTAEIIESGNLISDTHSKILKVNLGKSYSGSPKDYRTKILPSDKTIDLSSYSNKYLIFDIYNDTLGSEGSPFVALRDSAGRQIAGWCESYGPYGSYYYNYIGKGKWTTICIDLSQLMLNTDSESGIWQPRSFDFSSISWIWIGYWAEGNIYIDNITFSDVIP